MYPITNEVKALFEAEQPKVLRITGTDKNGATISITDDNVMEDSFQIDRYSCNGEKLEVGTAVAAQMTMTLENGSGTYDAIAFEGAELFVEVGVADWTQENPTVYWVPCGYFTPDEQPRRLSTISITGLDRMTRFDAVPLKLEPWTTANGDVMTTGSGETIYFVKSIRFPATIAQIVAQAAALCNVPFTQDLSGLLNASVSISELPIAAKDITFRNIIQWCAGVMGTNAWIDWTGTLRFSWYDNATGYVCTIDNRYSSGLYENDLTVTGVMYTNSDGIEMVDGTDEYALDLTGNSFVGPMITTVLPAINAALNGFTYRPFTAAVVNAPYLWPMDIVTFTDKDGNDHTSVLTNVAFGLNGTTALEAKGMTYVVNQGVQPYGFTKQQAQLVNEVKQSIANLDDSLTQEEIFNRLTDNGAAQGIVLYNGQLYVNASYMRTGTLVANLIKAGILGDVAGKNYWNMETGEFSLSATTTVGGSTVEDIAQVEAEQAVEDFDDTLTQQDVFNRLTNNGAVQGIVLSNGQLYINAGYINAGYLSAARIKGDTLTLGGDNNVNGVLRVLDANGNVITTLNNSGADIVNGSITTYSTDQQTRTILSDGLLKFQFYNSGVQPIGWLDALRIAADSQSATIGTFAGIAQLNIKGRGRVYISNQDAVTDEHIAELDLDDDLARLHAYTFGEGTTNLDVQGDGLTLTIDNQVGDPFIFHLIEGQSDHPMSIGNGGTGANTAAGARANLGITPANIGAVSNSGDTINGDLTIDGDLSVNADSNIGISSDYEIVIGDTDAKIVKLSDGTVFMQSSGDASVYVTDGGDTEIRSDGGAASIILDSNGDINVNGMVKDNRILQATSALPIPSTGSTSTVSITGLTSNHQLMRWNFSSSAENAPPADLTWATYDGYFTIMNNGGTTSESITPVFVLPQ